MFDVKNIDQLLQIMNIYLSDWQQRMIMYWYKNFTLILVFGMGFLILLLANIKKNVQKKNSIHKGEK